MSIQMIINIMGWLTVFGTLALVIAIYSEMWNIKKQTAKSGKKNEFY